VQPGVTKSVPWWLWPTVLSLDAPAVAVLWQDVLFRGAGAAPTPAERFILGVSVWLAYTADRWIEGWRLPPGRIQTHRHRFYQRWRWEVFAVWVVALAAAVALSVAALAPAALEAGAVLLALVAAYLLSHQFLHRRSPLRAPKEVCVAVLLGGGAAVFAASRPDLPAARLVLPLALFILLCFANCTLISVWENEVDRSHGQTSLALQFRSAPALARFLPWAIAGAAAVLTAAGWAWPAAGCAAASGLFLGLVSLGESRIGRMLARVLADVALLSPLVPLLFGGTR
jgi:hypothetical protein